MGSPEFSERKHFIRVLEMHKNLAPAIDGLLSDYMGSTTLTGNERRLWDMEPSCSIAGLPDFAGSICRTSPQMEGKPNHGSQYLDGVCDSEILTEYL